MLTDHRRNDAAQPFLVVTVPESGFFPGIRKETTFNQNACAADFFHQIDPADWLAFSIAARIERRNQLRLQLPPQLLAALGMRVEYLRTAVTGIAELILMDADKQCVAGFIDNSDPFLQIRYFFPGDGIAGGVNRNI